MNKIISILSNIKPEVDFTTSTDFIADGLLDSFDVVALVSELDKIFFISIDGIDIIPENFKNINVIQDLLIKNGIDL